MARQAAAATAAAGNCSREISVHRARNTFSYNIEHTPAVGSNS